LFSNHSRASSARAVRLSVFVVLLSLAFSTRAHAEKVIAKGDDWQVYTDGRVAGFWSWVYGQGYPQDTVDPNTGDIVHNPIGGGWRAATDQNAGSNKQPDAGTINSMRIRTGFIGNQLGVGVRQQLSPWTSVTGYIQIWAWIESTGRIKNQLNYADVRQGYAKLEGPWGSLLAGRTRALFSRGATDIDSLYAHRWGLGFPGNIDSNGPTLGQIGFGVLGSGFAAGLIYASPVLKGFQLSVGAFDPIQLQGNGAYNRTKYVRPEAEVTFEAKFGERGKLVLFANGAYQKIYRDGYCDASAGMPCDQAAGGVGFGGRFEIGPYHLGVAGHRGKGLGFNYALEPSDAAVDLSGILRVVDGYYLQNQVVLGKFDLFAGWGIVRAFLTDYDNHHPEHSVIKDQIGYNAGVVYNYTPNVHFDLDFFRAQADWFLGEKQVLYVSNVGLTFNW